MWASPYDGLADDEIETKYAAEEFPALEGISARDAIQMCWDERYKSAGEVAGALKALTVVQSKRHGRDFVKQTMEGQHRSSRYIRVALSGCYGVPQVSTAAGDVHGPCRVSCHVICTL